jgi:polysaccharide chain length determinant protein (PEP-CTERM system associated)
MLGSIVTRYGWELDHRQAAKTKKQEWARRGAAMGLPSMQIWKSDLLTYVLASWRYRWIALAAAWLVCLAGWFTVAFIPNNYESSAEVYIDSDTLLNPLLKGLAVTNDPYQQILVMLQTLITDPTLERVIRATNPTAASMSTRQMQDTIASLRKQVALKPLRAKQAYSITYRSEDPAYAQLVAQTLVSVLIDSSLGGKRKDADIAGSFLDAQIAGYQEKLEAADKRRAEFKTKNLEFFSSSPNGERLGGAGDVVAAQEAVRQAEATLNEAMAKRDSLRSQLDATPKTLNVNAALPATMDRAGTAISHRTQLAAAIARQNDLRTRLTDNHPEVVSQRRLIERLRSEKSEDIAGGAETESVPNPSYVMILSKSADFEAEVLANRNRLDESQKRLQQAKAVTAKAINLQRDYENLDRDYQVIQKNYQELVARRESAKITQAAGDQQGSFVFRVISPPARPDRPVAPNRLLLNAGVLLAGLGAGGALAFGLGQFSGAFLNLRQLKEAIDLPVLGVVTAVRTATDISGAIRSNLLFAVCVSILMISCAAVLYLFHTPLAIGGGSAL